MNYNYHTHTHLCGHASGTPEEYVLRAIENKIEYMGFSDHIPFIFPDGFESGHRVPMAQAEKYIRMISDLSEKYKDEIEIKIGFESEYFPLYFDDMLKIAIDLGAEYLILGQHHLYNGHPDGFYSGTPHDDENHLKEYVQNVVDAINSGVFTYVAHPDLINFTGNENLYNEEMRKICVASREKNIPLEINFLGIRGHRAYPREAFLKIMGEEKPPVTFGFDSHDTPSAFDGESLTVAKELVKKYKLNYIGIPKIINIQHFNNFK